MCIMKEHYVSVSAKIHCATSPQKKRKETKQKKLDFLINSLSAKCIYACILTQPYNNLLFLLQRIALNSTFYIYKHACKSVQYTNMHVTSM